MVRRILSTCLLPLRLVAGFDAFISYSRSDGTEYGEALLHALSTKISPRMDVQGTVPKAELPFSLKLEVALSKVLIVIATEGAAKSVHVAAEIETFLTWSRGPVIRI